MKLAKLGKTMLVLGMATACAFVLFACGGTDAKSSVAATVNGTEIPESEITDSIQNMHAQLALEEEDGTAAPYPRPVRKSPDWEDGGLDAPGLFAGIPAALPLVAAPVCGAGFVACCLGVLRAIGLL